MAYRQSSANVKQGTLCFADRWVANTTLMCSDRLPGNQTAKMFIGVDWVPDRQDGQIQLKLRMLREGQELRIVFPDATDHSTYVVSGDEAQLVNLASTSDSPSGEADVALDVMVDDDVKTTVPLSVGQQPYQVRIELIEEDTEEAGHTGEPSAEETEDSALPALVAEQSMRVRAVVEPATAGTIRWLSVMPETLEIVGETQGESVEIKAHLRYVDYPNARTLLALFTPEGAGDQTESEEPQAASPSSPGVMALQQFALAQYLVYRGRIVDSIGVPLNGATVQAQKRGGLSIGQCTADEHGNFELRIPYYRELVIVASQQASRTRRYLKPQRSDMRRPQNLNDIQIRLPVNIGATVGLSGSNNPADLRRVQDRLYYLGRLTNADVTAEAINIASTTAIDAATVPRLMTALQEFYRARFGCLIAELQTGGMALAALNEHPLFPLAHIQLANPVGDVPGAVAGLATNTPAEVRKVQERLFQLQLLTETEYLNERVSTTAPAPIDPLHISVSLAALRRLQTSMALGSLKCVVQERSGWKRLNDPYQLAKTSIRLSGSVGSGGENRPADVRAVQERLLELNLLRQADFDSELVAVPDPATTPHPDPIADSALPLTIAAITRLRETLLGHAASAEGRVDLPDPAVARLNHPPRVDLFGVVGEVSDRPELNRGRDVRALQDRLYLLGFLTETAYNTEKVNPTRHLISDTATLSQTLAAIRTYRRRLLGETPETENEHVVIEDGDQPATITLGGVVGAGQANHYRDVRPLQDRLFALRLLSQADYDREKVEVSEQNAEQGVSDSALSSTFAAISQFKERVLKLPPAMPDEAWTAHGVVETNDVTCQFLSNPLFFGREPLSLQDSVGKLGWNRATDCRALQDRLYEYKVITQAHYEAERVDSAERELINDSVLTQTMAAITRFKHKFLNTNPQAVGRVEAYSQTYLRMNSPFFTVTSTIDIDGEVGAGAANSAANVRKIQERLRDLGFLSQENYRREAISAVAGPVADASIPQTISSIDSWSDLILRAPSVFKPFDISLRKLNNPMLPLPITLNITGAVGNRAGVNQQANVRRVQDRLLDLGLLSTSEYLQERAPAGGATNINQATIPFTLAAIDWFQHTASGGTDGVIDPGGNTERFLEDPTYATPTTTNPHTDYRSAGPVMPPFPHAVQKIILAIEAHEAGGSSGEVPAILHNGSQTPASLGKAQVIGPTGYDTLNGNPAFAAFYDLGAAELAVLHNIIDQTADYYDDIYTVEVPAVVTEAQLVLNMQAYIPTHLAAFHSTTGLGEDDIENMFRTAQFRRQVRDFIDSQTGANESAKRAAAVTNVADLFLDADVAANTTALHIHQSDARAFLRRLIDNEHRAGFITRALLFSPFGQVFRNALTDDSGFKIGRFVIRDNYNRVTSQESATGVALTALQRAQITARIHNSGPSGLAGFVASPATAVNSYVTNVMAHWTP